LCAMLLGNGTLTDATRMGAEGLCGEHA
jgi:hypothetical protein